MRPDGGARWHRVVVAVLVAIYLAQAARFDFLCDDAYISFRYAKNLVEGHGLRFNCAESPPIEGFSNFLWVLWLALAERVGWGAELASRAASVACGALLVVRIARFLRARIGLGPGGVALAGVFYVLFPPVGVWATSGLAITPFALLFFLCFEAWLGDERAPRPILGGVLGLALALLRTEGMLWLGLLIGMALVLGWRRDGRRVLRRAWPGLAIVGVGFTAFLAWRVSYFGDWVSNTARAKGEMTAFTLQRGLAYAGSFLLEHPGFLLALAAVPWVARRERGDVLLTASSIVLASFSFAVLVGGDFMPFYRFFVLAAPFATLLVGLLVRELRARGAALRVGASALVLVATGSSFLPELGLQVFPESLRERCRFRWNFFLAQDEEVPLGELDAWERSKANCELWVRLGKALDAVAAPGDSLVLGPIGAVGYWSELHLYDQGGLVDRDVASRPPATVRRSPGHDRAVPIRWFAEREPTYAFARLTTRRPGLERAAARAFALYLDRPEEGDMGRHYAVEIVDLPTERGFASDEVLILGRRIEPEPSTE